MHGAVLLLAGVSFGCGGPEGENPAQAPLQSAARAAEPTYVGSQRCSGCHTAEYQAWAGSHHQQAMLTPTADSVVGDFSDSQFVHDGVTSTFFTRGGDYFVRTNGPTGDSGDYPVRYTFGVEPLQQYLLELPGGRVQAFGVAWDSRPETQGGQRWFQLYPEESADHNSMLHWSRDSQSWNYMCADCHSTNVRKRYDQDTLSYDTQFSELNVGCEACHGPASTHLAAWAEDGTGERALLALTSPTEQINACAPCHSRRSQLAEGFRPGQRYLDHYLPALLDEGRYFSDGQILDEVYVYGSFLQSRMHANGVTCGHCHEPHSATLRPAGNGLCTQCHSATPRPDFPTLRAASYDTSEHHHHRPGTEGARCVDCHMPQRTYMQVDDRRDHSFRVPRPDLTVSLRVPNTCNFCHADKSPQWASEVVTERFGAKRPVHFAPLLHAARRVDPDVEQSLSDLAGDTTQPPIVRATALALMTEYGRSASSFALQQGLRDPDPLVRLGALRGAERWQPQQLWREAAHLLDDSLRAVRTEAVRVLAGTFATLSAEQQPRLAAGIAEYMSTWSLHEDRAEAQTGMASVFAASGDSRRAEQALRLALSLNPQWVPALVNLADLHRATGRDPEGGPLLDQALDSAPGSADVLLAKALWLVRQNRAADALPLLAKAAQISPDVPRYNYGYAVALHSAGHTEQALDVLDATLARRPNDQQLLQAAAAMAGKMGDAQRMQRYLQRSRR